MEEVSQISKRQNKSINETSNKFMGISKSIEGMNHLIDQINESGQEMLNKQERIIEIMTNLSAISEASILLAKLAGQMKEAVDRFQY